MKLKSLFRHFFLPEFNRRLFIRLGVIALTALVVFTIFKPCFISGSSMEPTFRDNQLVFSCRLSYLFRRPERGDVVSIAFFGRRELLKRIVALPGDTVEFKKGKLLVNKSVVDEPYLKFDCDWDLPEITVRPEHCFAVGDNRSQSHLEHRFGEIDLDRITGEVWF